MTWLARPSKPTGPARRTRPESGRGFTVVELLVVVTVIAILASLLLPALSRARISADAAGCKAHLRQWGVALQIAVDENGAYPRTLWSASHPPVNADDAEWYTQLAQYAGTPGLTWVDAAPLPGRSPEPIRKGIQVCPGWARLWGNTRPRWIGSYGYNEMGAAEDLDRVGQLGLGGERLPGGADDFRPIKENEIATPSDMMAIGDALLLPRQTATAVVVEDLGIRTVERLHPNYAPVQKALGGRAAVTLDRASRTCLQRAGQRHGGRWNVLFCDGHVSGLSGVEIFDTRRTEVLLRWNRDHLPHYDLTSPWVP